MKPPAHSPSLGRRSWMAACVGSLALPAWAAAAKPLLQVWKDPYDVLLVARNGSATVFQSYR